MPQLASISAVPTWWERIKAWLHQKTRPAGEIAQSLSLPDVEVMATWMPVTQTSSGNWRFNPVLDLPLKPYAGMDKNKLWAMFVYRLTESEARNILDVEQSWVRVRRRNTIDSAPLEVSFNYEPEWKENRENEEPPLRLSDLAAAVIVWLWRNGVRFEAVSVFLSIWQMVRENQERRPQECIPWPAESALEGFRVAAYCDWDDDDQAEFTALVRERYVDREIEQGIKNLIS